MDYEGKYFPDEDDIELSKGKKLRKKIVKYSFYGIVAVVYIVSMIVLFSNCEPDMYKEVTFSKEAIMIYDKAPDKFEVYRIFPKEFMNYDGSVQLDTVAYTPTANEMEFGVKFNKKLINGEKKPSFTLVDTNGNTYTAIVTKEDRSGRYIYYRISFTNVKLNLEDNVYINPNNTPKAEGEGEAFDTLKYSFRIEYTDGKAPEELNVFNSNTAIEPMEFKPN